MKGFLLALTLSTMSAADFESQVAHGYADSGGVRIHYAASGPANGPLAVFIHGFPDYWYTWREQMAALSAAGYRCVAMDLRGYNLSDKPADQAAYDMKFLVGDVVSVIKANGREKAIVIGHDWGGAIAWQTAFFVPSVVEKLIVLNLPHLRGLARELASNPDQQKASAYARNFQQPDSHTRLDLVQWTGWVKDSEARKKYVEAMGRTSTEATMFYYRQNYPREPYQQPAGPVIKPQCPVLQIHGLKDTALLPPALNGTWDWVDDWTLVTIPEAGHFVQQDASEKVTRSILMWLKR